MTRRLLALAAATAFSGSLLAAALANACQSDSCPQTPTCPYVRITCIYPM